MTLDQLRAFSRSTDAEALTFARRMARFCSNILGSPSYMLLNKRNLCQLISYHSSATIWWTLSLANYYWSDLQNVFGEPPSRMDNESDEAFSKR